MDLDKTTHRGERCRTLAALAAAMLACATCGGEERQGRDGLQPEKGSVIFIHPDGSGLSHFNAMRMLYYGPDGISNYDRLPEMAVYRGHMKDAMAATSHGGATTHAYGYRVAAAGSFGTDAGRAIPSLSGFAGSIMEEAKAAGLAIGLVNDGILAEPGTGAFLASVERRSEANEITRQIMAATPEVVLGGGEESFLPAGVQGVHGAGVRRDGRNLIQEAREAGYTVLRTRGELEALLARIEADADRTPRRVLGLFARSALFQDLPEETLATRGMLPYGAADPASPGYGPPTVAAMTELALHVLQQSGRRFLLVSEIESVDNFGNHNNAAGMLEATKIADDTIGVALDHVERHPRTLVLTAADSVAGGPEIVAIDPDARARPVGSLNNNPIAPGGEGRDALLPIASPLDGVDGRLSPPFVTAPDASGRRWPIAIAWSGTPDFGGGILTRAAGLNAELLRTPELSRRFDNIGVYRMMYATLFGRWLPHPEPAVAPPLAPTAP